MRSCGLGAGGSSCPWQVLHLWRSGEALGPWDDPPSQAELGDGDIGLYHGLPSGEHTKSY